MSRERDILAAELRGSTAEFLGWLTGLKPPSDREAIPVEMRPAFEKMCNRLALAAEQYAADRIEALEALVSDFQDVLDRGAARIEALEAALRKIDTHLDNFGYLPNMKARKVARAALSPEQDKP